MFPDKKYNMGRRSLKYWILFTSYYCPLCGRDTTFRERIYDRPKPEDWNERHIMFEEWDYCDAL